MMKINPKYLGPAIRESDFVAINGTLHRITVRNFRRDMDAKAVCLKCQSLHDGATIELTKAELLEADAEYKKANTAVTLKISPDRRLQFFKLIPFDHFQAQTK